MRTSALLLALALAVLAADLKLRKPQVPIPEQWSPARPADPKDDLSAVRTWWRSFDDPLLSSLVEHALDSNVALKLALARVVESRATRGLATSALLPSIGISGGFTRLRGGIAQGLTGRIGTINAISAGAVGIPSGPVAPREPTPTREGAFGGAKGERGRDTTERVDSRVLQVIYQVEDRTAPVYVGQQLDVFIEAPARDGSAGRPSPTAARPDRSGPRS